MQGGFEVKVLECYQPRGIAKLAFFVLCLGMIPFCGHLVMKDEETSGYVYRPPKVRPKNLTIGGRYFYGKIQL